VISQDKVGVLLIDVSMCYARLKVRVLTLKRAEHFQSSKYEWLNTRYWF